MRYLLTLVLLLWSVAASAQPTGVFSKICFGACATAPQDLTGAVDPEASTSACPGSTFRRTSGGTVGLYVKQAGTGCDNTGWVEVGTGGSGADAAASYITKVAEAGLSNEFPLGALATGLLKNTTTTGVPTIAVAGTDYVVPGAITTSALTMSTARVLCRTTASTGAVEECTSIPPSLGGLGLTSLCADDEVAVSNGSVYQCKAVPLCNSITEKLHYATSTNTFSCQTDQVATGAGSGDVVGPASATDECFARYNTTTGKLIQDSVICATDTGTLTLPDGIRQTFNPNATNAGLNVGAHAGNPSAPTDGDLWYNSSGTVLNARINGVTVSLGAASGGGNRTMGITVDGAGSAITTGVKGFSVAPISGTIVSATLLSTDASATACSVVFDVWKDTYANYPPTDADSITASAPPTLSSANKSQDTTLTGWTTSVTAGAVFGYNVDSVTSCTRVTLTLTITP